MGGRWGRSLHSAAEQQTMSFNRNHDVDGIVQSLLSWQSHLLRLLRLMLTDADALLNSASLSVLTLFDCQHLCLTPVILLLCQTNLFTSLSGCHQQVRSSHCSLVFRWGNPESWHSYWMLFKPTFFACVSDKITKLNYIILFFFFF